MKIIIILVEYWLINVGLPMVNGGILIWIMAIYFVPSLYQRSVVRYMSERHSTLNLFGTIYQGDSQCAWETKIFYY